MLGGQATVHAVIHGPEAAKAGDEIDVDLDLQSDRPVVSAHSILGFDPKALKLLDAQPGKFFTQGGGSLKFMNSSDVAGQVSIVEALTGGVGGLSRDHAVTLRFKVLPESPASTGIELLSLMPASAYGQAFVPPGPSYKLQVTK